MLRYRPTPSSQEFVYDHDTRRWGVVKYTDIGWDVRRWHQLSDYDDEEDLDLPDDYADWLPDN